MCVQVVNSVMAFLKELGEGGGGGEEEEKRRGGGGRGKGGRDEMF